MGHALHLIRGQGFGDVSHQVIGIVAPRAVLPSVQLRHQISGGLAGQGRECIPHADTGGAVATDACGDLPFPRTLQGQFLYRVGRHFATGCRSDHGGRHRGHGITQCSDFGIGERACQRLHHG